MAKNSTARATIEVTTNAQKAKNDIEAVNSLLKKLQKTKQLMMKEGLALDKDGKETATFKKLNQDIKAATQALKDNISAQEKMKATLSDLGNIRLKDLKRRYRELSKELGNFSGKEKAVAEQWRNDLAKIKNQITQIEGAGAGASKSMMGLGGSLKTTLKNLVAYAGVFAIFNTAKAKLEEIVKLNKEFSDQLANIRKVSNLPMDSINQLADNLAKIDTRSSVQQLNELAYTGAKLGFGSLGTDALEGFVKSAVVVQNALSEDMGSDAMTALSKMVEVMGLIPKMGVERAMNAVGSAIFKLASTSTATGSNIVEFSKRLMGLANIAHITSDELLAIGSASDSLALMPEVSATAFNKLITAVQKQPNLIENALHIEPGTISQMYQAGKMTDALVMIFEKMREKGGMNALMQSGIFKDLGSDGARLVAVMATMSNRVDILKEHLQTARDAFAEGTAVGQEYAIQMETAEAYAERAANMWTKAFVNPEGVNVVKSLTKAWYEMSVQLTQSESVMSSVKFALEGLVSILKIIISILPGLISGLMTFGGIKCLMMVYNSLFAVEGMAVKTMFSLRGLGLMMKTNWVGWVVTAVGVLAQFAFSLASAKDKIDQARGVMPGFKNDLSDLNVEFGAAAARAARFRDAILSAAQGTKERAAAIKNFKDQYGQYLSQMITEESSAYAIARAYNEVTKALRAKIALQMKEGDINKQVAPREQWAAQRREEYNKYMGQSQFNGAWLTGVVNDALASGTSIKNLAKQLNEKAFHLSDEIVENALKQTASDTYRDVKGVKTENGDIFREINGQNLWRALRYATQSYATNTALNRVNEKWKPEEGIMNDLLAKNNQQETYDPLIPARDKAAEKALTKAQQEEKKRLRKEMEDAQRDSTAVINAIEEFYRLQESMAEQLAADGKLTRSEADKMIDYIRNRKDEMLLEARRAITGNENNFESLRKTMGKDLLRPEDTASKRAMETVQTVNVNAAAAKLKKFDGSAGVYDLSSGSFTQSVLKNAAQNELNIQRRQSKVTEEIDKMLMQYQYVEQAQKEFGNDLVKLGIITEGYDKVVQQLADGTEVVANTKDVQALATKVQGMDTRLFNVDYDDAEELRNMVDYMMSTVDEGGNRIRESFASMFPKLDEWMQEPEKYKKEMQAFYQTLIDYDTKYYEALKKAHDQQKKVFEERWEISGKGRAYSDVSNQIDVEGRQQKMTGADQGTNFAQMAGFAQIGQDPEVQASLLRMAQMQEELEMFKQTNEAKNMSDAEREAFMQGVHEREMALAESEMAMQEALMANINEQISKMSQWTQPIEQFGSDVGDALGKTLASGESFSEGMKNALQSLVKSWGDSTIQIVKQLMMQQLKQKLVGKMMVKETKQTQGQMTDETEEGGENRLKATNILETGMASVTQTVGQQILQQKQSQDSAELAAEGTKTTGTVMAGIAQGAAKIIGTLGPWGAPLIAVITALLMGLLSAALGALFGGSSDNNNEANKAKTNVKLASGMLTYDKGNVGMFAGRRKLYDDGTTQVYGREERPMPFAGEDGRVYMATPRGGIPEGVSLVRKPIATTVNGQPSLVAERGPEIVIGRKTTQRIMMDEPRLLHHLAMLDSGRRHSGYRGLQTFDDGNIDNMLGGAQTGSVTPAGGIDSETAEALKALPQVLAAFSEMMGTIQQKGIPAKLNRFGKDSLDEGMREVNAFRKRYPVG